MNLQKEIKAYLLHCEHQKKLSPKSTKAYAIDLGQFVRHVNSMAEPEITKQTILSYIADLHQKYRPQTVKRKLASLRAFFNHLEFEEIIEVNPIRRIKTKFQEPKLLPKTIPLKLVEQLLVVAHQERRNAKTAFATFAAQRDAAIVEMLFATGMRVSELCSLKAEAVNLDDGNIYIIGKGLKERIIQIGNTDVLAFLRQYMSDNASRIHQSGFFLQTG
jgi:integrase/recombinase XerD